MFTKREAKIENEKLSKASIVKKQTLFRTSRESMDSGKHTWNVDQETLALMKGAKCRDRFTSSTFNIAGLKWKFEVYPNGNSDNTVPYAKRLSLGFLEDSDQYPQFTETLESIASGIARMPRLETLRFHDLEKSEIIEIIAKQQSANQRIKTLFVELHLWQDDPRQVVTQPVLLEPLGSVLIIAVNLCNVSASALHTSYS